MSSAMMIIHYKYNILCTEDVSRIYNTTMMEKIGDNNDSEVPMMTIVILA